MKSLMILSIIISLMCCTNKTTTNDPSGNSEGKTIKVISEHRGIISASVPMMQKQEQEQQQSTSKEEGKAIRTLEEFNGFSSSILHIEVSKTSPSIPSDDPLLKSSPAKFPQEMMLSITREDGMYGKIELVDIQAKNNKIIVRYKCPPLEEETKFLAQPYGLGTYLALVVEASSLDVEFVKMD